MATKRPSYLKRQKEQKRVTRAIEKRDARKVRKETKSDPNSNPLDIDYDNFDNDNFDNDVQQTEDRGITE